MQTVASAGLLPVTVARPQRIFTAFRFYHNIWIN
jgi:hypothetical protein